jgi:hypothetical protein
MEIEVPSLNFIVTFKGFFILILLAFISQTTIESGNGGRLSKNSHLGHHFLTLFLATKFYIIPVGITPRGLPLVGAQ